MRLAVGLVRSLLTAAVTTGAVLATWLLTGHATRTLAEAVWSGRITSDRWTVDALVGALAAAIVLVAVAGLAAVLALSATAVLLDRRTGPVARLCRRVTPRLGRRLVAVCCGIGLAAPLSLGTPALADDGPARLTCHRACRVARVELTGLDLPDLPTGHGHPGEPARPPGQRRHGGVADPARVVVRRGDSLWSIATGRLPASAPDAEVEALTRALYLRNRSTIGTDPDLILPGLTLFAPEGPP